MKPIEEGRIERLLEEATGSLDPASLWLIGTCVPERQAALTFDPAAAAEAQNWVRKEAGSWPAPLKIGDSLAECRPRDRLIFSPASEWSAGPAHYVELHADGACLIAVQIGNLRDAPEARGKLWAIGEGAIAWISVSLVRFVAAWAAQANILGPACVDLRLFSSAAPEDQADLQLWNFAGGANAPAGEARAMIGPSREAIDIATCLTGTVTLVARSLLLPVLVQLGQDESRHIDAAGIITSGNFVGHAPSIIAWARRIRVSFR